MSDATNPIEIIGLVKALIGLGPIAIQYIQKLKRRGKGKEVEGYIRDITDRIQKMKLLVVSLYAYRLLNLHTTEILDDIRDMPEKTLNLKALDMQNNQICAVIRKDLQRTTNFFRQNLNNFRMERLDYSHAAMMRYLISKIGQQYPQLMPT